MNKIIIETEINAPVERCFDLSISIDLHKISASKSKEQAIAGITTGLIKLGESVTWRAKHFGLWFKMTVEIVEFKRPNYFIDEMTHGIFKSMKHKHEFSRTEYGTLMTDIFEFSSPFGFIGKIVDKIILRAYLTQFLEQRNQVIKDFAESDKWKAILN